MNIYEPHGSTTGNNVYPIRPRQQDTTTSHVDEEHLPPGMLVFLDQLQQLFSLPENWDGYGAAPISRDAYTGAVTWAQYLIKESTPAPDVFPVPNGNVQIEWSCNNIDLEIEVFSASKCKAYYEDLVTGETWIKIFKGNLTSLTEVISRLELDLLPDQRPLNNALM